MNRRQALSKASRIVGDIRRLDQIQWSFFTPRDPWSLHGGMTEIRCATRRAAMAKRAGEVASVALGLLDEWNADREWRVAGIVDQAVHVVGCTTSSRAILRDILSPKAARKP